MEVYDVAEVAKKLKCSKDKVYEFIRQEQIKPITKIGKSIRVPEVSLEAFILGVPTEELLKKKYETNVIEVNKPQVEKSIDYEAIGKMFANILKQNLSDL